MRADKRTDVTTLVVAFPRLSRKATKLIVTECEIGQDRNRRLAVVKTVMNCHAPQQAINFEQLREWQLTKRCSALRSYLLTVTVTVIINIDSSSYLLTVTVTVINNIDSSTYLLTVTVTVINIDSRSYSLTVTVTVVINT